MTMSVKAETQKTAGPQECAGCGKKIQDRYLLKALDMYWHEDCLKCGCCDCRLGEVGSTLFTKGNLILCKRDYLRLFGTTGYCAACQKVIPAFEMVMRARTNVYHLECFACQQCNHRFCVGDRFFLCDNKILCEYDYEERMVFANLAYNSNSLAQMKNQATRATGALPPPPPCQPPLGSMAGPGAKALQGHLPGGPPNGLPLPPLHHPATSTSSPLPPMPPMPPPHHSPHLNGHHMQQPLPGMGMLPPPPPSSSSSSLPLPPTTPSNSTPLPPMSATGPPLPPMQVS